MYHSPFTITSPTSNNAFSYPERERLLTHSPELFVAERKQGTLDDLIVGTRTAFEEVENDKLMSCPGLETFLEIEIPNSTKKAVIFDNHNHAFAFWIEALNNAQCTKGIPLVHIDQHKDMRVPDSWLDHEYLDSPEQAFTYTNTVLNVGNFIQPALHVGLFSEVFLLDNEASFQKFLQNIPEHFVLDIDMDLFVPELDFMNQDWLFEQTKMLLAKADFVTIATSPYFMDPELAITLVKKLFTKKP